MDEKGKIYSKAIRRRLLIIKLLFIIILLLAFLAFFLAINSGDRGKQLSGFFSGLDISLQKVSGNANFKYALLSGEEAGKLDSLNMALAAETAQLEQEISGLLSGKISFEGKELNIEPYIRNIDIPVKIKINWQEYQAAVMNILNADQYRAELAESATKINYLGNILAEDIGQMEKAVFSFLNGRNRLHLFAVAALFFITLAIFVWQLQQNALRPLMALYNGIHSLGMLNKDTAPQQPAKKEISPIVNEINNSLAKLKKLIGLIENISQSISFDDTLKFIYTSFAEFIPYSHIGIALLKDEGKVLEASYGISDPALKGLSQKLYGIKADISNTSLGNVIEKGIPRVINDLTIYPTDKNKSYNRILLDSGIKSSITLPLKLNNKPVGVIFFSSMHKNIYQDQHISFLETLRDSIAISLNKNIFVDELIFSTILALAKMAEARDEDTGNHLERMQKYSVKIAEFLIEDKIYEDELDFAYLRDIERFSPMHDIGKVGVRDEILLKPGKLTPEEYEEMKKHVLYGAEVLKVAESNMLKHNKSLFKVGIEIVEGHHEKWDGSGYPYGKSGFDIPLSARIVAVADVFDALTSVRPYKKALSFEDSLKIIQEGKGKHFDPNIIDAIMRHRNELYEIYSSFSSNFDMVNKTV